MVDHKIIEHRLGNHEKRLDSHSRRLQLLERIVWIAGGVAVALQYYPLVQQVFG